MQYLVLLRAINVGGKNVIKMSDLKNCFQKIGFEEVSTFIQSGNVIFKTPEIQKQELIKKIEKELLSQFKNDLKIVLISIKELETIVNEVPAGFGNDPDRYKYDVIFLRDGLSPVEIIKTIKKKEGVDTADSGTFTLYFSRLISKATQSHLKFILSHPEYQNMTIRNWNTTKKLYEIMCNSGSKS